MADVVLISGAGRGIGRATTKLLGARGWSVGVNFVQNERAAQETVADVVQAGGNACAIRGNVADEGDAIAMFDAVESAFGRIDVLVNNTGIVAPSMSLADMSVARLGSPHEYVDYAGSKGAIDTMTLGLAKELAAQGVRVNCVRPGLINTEIHASGGRPDRAAVLGAQTPAVASRDSA